MAERSQEAVQYNTLTIIFFNPDRATKHKLSVFIDDETLSLQKGGQLPRVLQIEESYDRLSGLDECNRAKVI